MKGMHTISLFTGRLRMLKWSTINNRQTPEVNITFGFWAITNKKLTTELVSFYYQEENQDALMNASCLLLPTENEIKEEVKY